MYTPDTCIVWYDSFVDVLNVHKLCTCSALHGLATRTFTCPHVQKRTTRLLTKPGLNEQVPEYPVLSFQLLFLSSSSMFTGYSGVNFDGNTIGLAFLNTVCTSSGHSLVEVWWYSLFNMLLGCTWCWIHIVDCTPFDTYYSCKLVLVQVFSLLLLLFPFSLFPNIPSLPYFAAPVNISGD